MQKKKAIKYATLILRWGIAIVGIFWVLRQISWRDQALVILPGSNVPQRVDLAEGRAADTDLQFKAFDPNTGSVVTIPREQVVNEPDKPKLQVTVGEKKWYVLGLDLNPDMKLKQVRRLLVAQTPQGDSAHWITPDQAPDYEVKVPHPRVEVGVIRMVREADLRFLLGAVLVIPITFLITSYRWHELLRALDINISLARAFVLNMVGLFYNTFMPGSTGGDLLKAWYVAKQTHHRTRAVMSVLVDRVIGLLALIILGGVMASTQWHNPICRRVAIGSAALIACVVIGCILLYVPALWKLSGLAFVASKLPMQKQVNGAIETMHILGRRPWLVLGALLISLPVHMVVVISALLSGSAFGLTLNPAYYFMAIPVIVLVGAIPISPQGAGVMEYFAVKLLEPQGVTVAQALALTMSIRLVQILWNLSGGFFVVRGGYHAPTQTEQKEVEAEDEDDPDHAPPAGEVVTAAATDK